MSRGSTLTLYRAYKNFKVPDEVHAHVVKCWAEYIKEHGFGEEKNLGDKLEAHLAPVLQVDQALNLGKWMERTEPATIEELRERRYTGYYLREERIWCDRLLSWTFGSGFDALVEEYNLGFYSMLDDSVLIGEVEARQMLVALEYLLSGRWDKRAEKAMHNRYIKLFADGCNAYSYSKYLEQERWARHKRVQTLEGAGYKVTVEFPELPASQKDDEQYWMEESREFDEDMERWFNDFANGLRAFLESDAWQYERDTKLVLEYSAWG